MGDLRMRNRKDQVEEPGGKMNQPKRGRLEIRRNIITIRVKMNIVGMRNMKDHPM